MRGRRAVVLGELELLVLLAVLSLGDEAYPLAVSDVLAKKAARSASRAAVHITLERLERKGFVTSVYGDPTPARGGRAKRYFRPKPAAIRAVRQSIGRIDGLAADLRAVLGSR